MGKKMNKLALLGILDLEEGYAVVYGSTPGKYFISEAGKLKPIESPRDKIKCGFVDMTLPNQTVCN